MTSGYIRKYEELICLYMLEPTIKDIYVEGSIDVGFFTWFFKESNIRNVNVYDIATLQFPDEIIHKSPFDLSSNNKNKVILLSYLFEDLKFINNQYRGIIDSDFDIITNVKYKYRTLLSSDYANLEMYLFNKRVITKFIDIFLRNFAISVDVLLLILSKVLQELFVVRLANEQLNYRLKWLDFGKLCKCSKLAMVFNSKEFVKRYLMKNGMLSKIDKFTSEINDWSLKLTDDERNQIHGHDFTNLFLYFIKNCCKFKVKFDANELTKILISILTVDDIIKEDLFVNISKWIQLDQ